MILLNLKHRYKSMIQKYKNNIQEDKKMILLSFKDMEQIYKDRIVDYSKISKFITLSEIKEHEN